jgi:hypothetical protein
MSRTTIWAAALFLTVGFARGAFTQDTEGERLSYSIHPLGGVAEYCDLGLQELDGRQVRVSRFTTNTFGFKDQETIFSDPQTLLPIRVLRDVRSWFSRCAIVEEYDQTAYTITIRKYKGDRLIDETVKTADGPIINPILAAFYPRIASDLHEGWSFDLRTPLKYKVTLKGVESIRIGDEIHQAYHFVSDPDKFEVWISADEARRPLKIKGRGGINYSAVLNDCSLNGRDRPDRVS